MSEILVIGDSCKDIYVYGSCARLCPDFPVPSFIPSYEKQNLGMADLEQYDAVVISDYNKGFLREEDIQFICENHDQVFIDTKKILGDFCKNCSFIKINQEEYNNSFEYINKNSWTHGKTIQTLAGKGCQLGDHHFPVDKVEIKDPCGAGDTFLAALCVNFLKTKKIEEAIDYANKCATIVVQKRGVTTTKED